MPTVLTSKKTQVDEATRAGMRHLAQTDLYSLATTILAADLPKDQNHFTWNFHRPLCNFMQTTPYEKNLYLLARDHLKTSLITVGGCVQRILKNPEVRILIASNKADNAIAMLSGIKSHLTNPILLWLFPEILYPDPGRESVKWTESAITVKRRRRGVREATVEAIGMEGEITSKHYDHITFDDLVGEKNSQTRDQVIATRQWWQKSQGLLEPGSTQDIIGCLPGDTEVLLETGESTPISLIKPGDLVWASDEDGSLAVRTVKALVPQGEDRTYTIRTSSKVVRATENHPFLVCRSGKLVWAPASSLREGEYLVSIKEIPGRLEHLWMTEGFCWLFGFILGDGWVSVKGHRGHIGICVSRDEELNARVLEVASEWLRDAPFRLTPFGFLRSDSQRDAVRLQELGLTGTAKTKRLPAWVFRLPPNYRRALLKGFCEADGHKLARCDDAWRVEIANRPLLEDLRRLAALCGVRTGTMSMRTRLIQPPNSPKPVRAESVGCQFNFRSVTRYEFYNWVGGSAARRRAHPHPGLRPERIVMIHQNPEREMVYDLTVTGTPSFFANGLACHNTPWHPNDLYLWLQEERDKHDMRLGLYKMPCWVPDENGTEVPGHGRVRPALPERFTIDLLLDRKRDQGSAIFAAQYLLDPIDDETAVFPRKSAVIRARDTCPPPEELWCAMTIDPAISTKAWADYSALAVCGFDRSGIMHVMDLRRGRWSEGKLIEEIYDAYGKTPGIRAIGFEAISFAKIYRREITRAGEQRGIFLPITTLERDTRTTKNVRIRALSPFWEHGEIILYDDLRALEEFLDEAQRFRIYREATHDDMLDCLADQMQLRARPSERDKTPQWLIDDPVLLERQQTEAQIADERAARGMPPLDDTAMKVARNMRQHYRRMDAEREAESLGVGSDEFYR